MQDDDLKIDVGEADEQEQEIDLDAKPVEEKVEEQIEVQQEEQKEEAPVENKKADNKNRLLKIFFEFIYNFLLVV